MKYIILLLLLIPSATAIHFTEIMFDPSGSDTNKEWIEIYTEKEITTDNLILFEADTNHKIKPEITIPANTHFIIARNIDYYNGPQNIITESVFSLKNTGETLKILYNNTVEDEISYYPTNEPTFKPTPQEVPEFTSTGLFIILSATVLITKLKK